MLKESVEKRLEPTNTEDMVKELANDPIKKLGEQADEIIDILADLGQAPNMPEIQEEPKAPETPKAEETPEMPEEPKEEPAAEPVVAAPIAPAAKKTGKNCNGVCWIIMLVVLAGLAATAWYFRNTLVQWWQCMQDCQPVVEEVVVVEEPVVVRLADEPREYVNFMGIERVGEDSRLAWIAYKYYAQKDLWVFIYEANRDIIKHPSHVRPGQYIRIPELDKKYRNLYNPELKQLVDSLAVEYLK
jgi:nucleoid-associated protein YgaU